MGILESTEFPIYGVREYHAIHDSGQYKIIEGVKNTYVLDCPTLKGNYYERRLKLVGMDMPYKLYPIDKRYVNIAQMVSSGNKLFIDNSGRIIKYVKSKYYPLRYIKILQVDRLDDGRYRLWTKLPFPFVLRYDQFDISHEYVGYLQKGISALLYETCEELKKDTRKKI